MILKLICVPLSYFMHFSKSNFFKVGRNGSNGMCNVGENILLHANLKNTKKRQKNEKKPKNQKEPKC